MGSQTSKPLGADPSVGQAITDGRTVSTGGGGEDVFPQSNGTRFCRVTVLLCVMACGMQPIVIIDFDHFRS